MSTFDSFTASTRLMLRNARQEAATFGQAQVEPEHLLLGLLCDEKSQATTILRILGVEPLQVYEALQMQVSSAKGAQEAAADTLTERSKTVVFLAVQEAKQAQQDYVGAEHFLLALAHEESGIAARQLRESGVTVEGVRAHLTTQQESTQEPAEKDDKATPFNMLSPQERAEKIASVRNTALCIWVAYVAIILSILLWYTTNFSEQLFSFAFTLLQSPLFAVQPLENWYPLLVLLLCVGIYAFGLLLMTPLYYVYGSWIPQRYVIPIRHNGWNWLKRFSWGHLLQLLGLLLLCEVGSALFVTQTTTWWLWCALFYGSFSFLRSQCIGPLAWSSFYTLTPLVEGELYERFAALQRKTHTSVEGLYVFEKRGEKQAGVYQASNGFIVSWWFRTRVVLSDYLVQRFSPDELEVIMAHELAHAVYRDTYKRQVWRVLLLLLALGCFHLLFLHDNYQVTNLIRLLAHLLSSPLTLVAETYLIYIIANIIYRFLYRRAEVRADSYALQLTQKPEAFKSGMLHLATSNLVSTQQGRRIKFLAAYPTLQERLSMADEFMARQKSAEQPVQKS